MLEISYMNELRRWEMEQVLPFLPDGCRVLDFGSGTGEQARFLAEHGFNVTAIDLPNSDYSNDRIFPIQDYDGRKIPLPDQSVDVIFSSNVLEHVANLDEISDEFRRVLKPNGFAIHVLPTAVWRSWTFLTALAESFTTALTLAYELARPQSAGQRRRIFVRELRHIARGIVPVPHGTGKEGVSELWTFSRPAWRRKFARLGFEIVEERPVGIFYTGTMLLGEKIEPRRRHGLSGILGSVTRIYLLKPVRRSPSRALPT
jgi:SAM-dependent methyltransferase